MLNILNMHSCKLFVSKMGLATATLFDFKRNNKVTFQIEEGEIRDPGCLQCPYMLGIQVSNPFSSELDCRKRKVLVFGFGFAMETFPFPCIYQQN